MFSSQPIFGPVVSVRNHGVVNGSSRIVSKPTVRTKKRGLLANIRKVAASASSMGTLAVYGLFLLFGAGVVSYIFLINSSAAKGYEMKKIQNRIEAQKETRHDLEIKSAQFASLEAIDQAAQQNSLVSVKNEEFLTPVSVTALKTSK